MVRLLKGRFQLLKERLQLPEGRTAHAAADGSKTEPGMGGNSSEIELLPYYKEKTVKGSRSEREEKKRRAAKRGPDAGDALYLGEEPLKMPRPRTAAERALAGHPAADGVARGGPRLAGLEAAADDCAAAGQESRPRGAEEGE